MRGPQNCTTRHRPTRPQSTGTWQHRMALVAAFVGAALVVAGLGPAAAVPLNPSQVAAITDLFALAQWDSTAVASTDCASLPSLAPALGIACDSQGLVLSLNMSNAGLSGSLPPSLGSLVNLEILDLQANQLEGSIPGSALSALQALRILNLRQNLLGNSIPDELSSLTGLSFLLLGYNLLSGNLPPSLGALTNLDTLVLRKNRLSGSIPPAWGTLTALTALDLGYNQLEGSYPDALNCLRGLQILSVGSNLLSGVIPQWLGGSYQGLKLLDLGENQLNGSIPMSIGEAVSLVAVSLDNNQLEGSLPASLGSLSNLQYFYAVGNKLSGNLPPALGSLYNLRALDLSGNAELGLAAPIPSWIISLINLQSIRLESCSFQGAIPPGLGHLALLQELYLHNNYLSASLPNSLCTLNNLQALDVSNNSLLGPIQPCLPNLAQITLLNVEGNLFTGEVPAVRDPDTTFKYAGNCLSPPAAAQLLLSSPACVQAGASFEEIPVTEPKAPASPGTPHSSQAPPRPPIATVVQVASPDQGFPQFLFSPPAGTAEGEGGPHSASPLPIIQQASAEAPPVEPQTALASAETPPGESGDSAWYGWLRVTLVVMLATVLAVLMCAVVMLLAGPTLSTASWVPRVSSSSPFLDQLLVTEYGLSKIKKATKNFSTLFGKGSFGTVFLAEDFMRDQPETRAIIKRASDPLSLGEFEFRSKVEELARARHPCCVNLLGYCTGKGERILVFEYLPNGTLFDRLHSSEVDPLPWEARVRIAVNVACALEFLHSSSPVMVHRAVTSSNILLTADMSAKLSDYGLARGGGSGMEMAPKRRRPTRIARGQVAASDNSSGGGTPGGGSSHAGDVESVSGSGESGKDKEGPVQNLEKVDVYGFGVVMLELLTGQKAMKDVHITSLAAPFLEDPQMMPLMVDAALGGYFNHTELVELGSIARDCVKEDPAQRPSMRQVVAHMESRLNIDIQLYHSLGDAADLRASQTSGPRGASGYSALQDPAAAGGAGGNLAGAAISAVSSAASSFRSLIGGMQSSSAPPTPKGSAGGSEAGDTESVNSSTILYITPKK